MLSTRQKIALAGAAASIVFGARRLIGRGQETTVRRRGISWNLDLSEGIDFAIYLFGAFEPATIAHYRRCLADGAVVIDIGANIGAHTLPLAQAVGSSGRVYAFEPTRFGFEKLARNLALNPDLGSRVTTEQMALDETSRTPPAEIAASWPLFARDGSDPLHGGRAVSTQGAQGSTLDDYVEGHGIARIDLIKLDVDGAECRVLRGARTTLERFRPLLMIELAPHVFEGSDDSLATLFELVDSAGYQLRGTPGGAPLAGSAERLAALLPAGRSRNAWAVPA